MVDFVKCSGEINSTQIGCTAARDVAIHNISHCTNSIAASDSFLEAKLIVIIIIIIIIIIIKSTKSFCVSNNAT